MNAQTMRQDRDPRVPEWRVSDRVRRAREYAELDQEQLAEITGISRATISNYERGRTTPSRGNYNLIAFATGVSGDWLRLGDSGEWYTPRDLNPEPTESRTDNVWSIDTARSIREPIRLTTAELAEGIAPSWWSSVEPDLGDAS